MGVNSALNTEQPKDAVAELSATETHRWCRAIARAFAAWETANPELVHPGHPGRDAFLVTFVLAALRDERTPAVAGVLKLITETPVCPCESCDGTVALIERAWRETRTPAEIQAALSAPPVTESEVH